eukprot:9256698-Lingulodinium_polyedra.AAC.1
MVTEELETVSPFGKQERIDWEVNTTSGLASGSVGPVAVGTCEAEFVAQLPLPFDAQQLSNDVAAALQMLQRMAPA